MATTYQIAAVGDWESVMGFRALGLDTYPVNLGFGFVHKHIDKGLLLYMQFYFQGQ